MNDIRRFCMLMVRENLIDFFLSSLFSSFVVKLQVQLLSCLRTNTIFLFLYLF